MIDDLDGDGDLDFLASEGGGRPLRWFEQAPLVGDVNGDGLFDSSDLVVVFAAGKYDLGIPGSATYAEGDWNDDGVFDSSDLVVAFRLGNYVPAAVATADLAAAIEAAFSQQDEQERSRLD